MEKDKYGCKHDDGHILKWLEMTKMFVIQFTTKDQIKMIILQFTLIKTQKLVKEVL